MLAATITTEASLLLQDTSNARWSAADLLTFLNDGQKVICTHRPDACMRNSSVQFSAGDAKQSLPSGAVRLDAVIRNMGNDGNTPGKPITIIPREHLDAMAPSWHTDTTTDEVEHYCYSAEDPLHYYIYPIVAAGTTLYGEISYFDTPTDCDAVTNTSIDIADIYSTVLLDYILYRALSMFQSTPPRRGRHGSPANHQTAGQVSIHAPA